MEKIYQELVEKAINARRNAYAPYSHFKVGAALLTKEGKVYTGCNIETCTLTPTICAERTTLFKAVSEGEREFKAIAIVGDNEKYDVPTIFASPCGVYRQALAEFCDDDLVVILATKDETQVTTLGELIPQCFREKKFNE